MQRIEQDVAKDCIASQSFSRQKNTSSFGHARNKQSTQLVMSRQHLNLTIAMPESGHQDIEKVMTDKQVLEMEERCQIAVVATEFHSSFLGQDLGSLGYENTAMPISSRFA